VRRATPSGRVTAPAVPSASTTVFTSGVSEIQPASWRSISGVETNIAFASECFVTKARFSSEYVV